MKDRDHESVSYDVEDEEQRVVDVERQDGEFDCLNAEDGDSVEHCEHVRDDVFFGDGDEEYALGHVVCTSTSNMNHRKNDPEFNTLLDRLRRIEDVISQPFVRGGDEGKLGVSSLDKFAFVIKDHSCCPTTGRKFVPGGEAAATKCMKTPHGAFPHVIQMVSQEEGGGTKYHVLTNKNILITCSMHSDCGSCDEFVSEDSLLRRVNCDLRRELQAGGEFPLTEIRMRMRFVAAHISHKDPDSNPVGAGETRWWDKDLCTEIEGERDRPQLLVPSETTGVYTKVVSNGKVCYSFKIRSGVTSSYCRAYKNCHFKFVCEPESRTLRLKCPKLTASTESFWVSSKYKNGDPPKVQTWVESSVKGGSPVAYDMKRKRPCSGEDNA